MEVASHYTTEQLWVSTAEEELNYFFSPAQKKAPVESGSTMPSGTYRVVDGSLYLILPELEIML